jgi:Protein kinase domain
MKSEEKSEEESKGSLTGADKNKFIPLKDSASFFGENLNHRQQAL